MPWAASAWAAPPSRSTRCSGCGWSTGAAAMPGTRRRSWRAASSRSFASDAGVKSWQVVSQLRAELPEIQRAARARCLGGDSAGSSAACSGRRRTSSARTPSRPPSSPAGCRAMLWSNRPLGAAVVPWSSPVRTTAAFRPRGRYQKRGSGIRSLLMLDDEVGEQALLLVGLRDRDLGRGRPSRAAVAPPKKRSSERIGADAVALLARPGRVALARLDDRPREVVGEGRGLAAARRRCAGSPPGWPSPSRVGTAWRPRSRPLRV